MNHKLALNPHSDRHALTNGEITTFLLGANDLSGRISVHHSVLPAGIGAPWHTHDHDDEIFYVLDGEVEFGVGDQDGIVAVAGDLVAAGHGVARRFRALTDSHLLVMNTPAGPAERFLRASYQLANAQTSTPTDAQRAEVGAQHGIHVLTDGPSGSTA